MPNATKLISLEQIRSWTNISQHIEANKIDPVILMTQELAMKDILGKPLYDQLITQKAADALSYDNQALIDEAIPYLAFSIVLAYLPISSVALNQKGAQVATDQFARNTNEGQGRKYMQYLRGQQEFYRNHLVGWIEDNKADYPLYETGDCRTSYHRTGQQNFRRIGKRQPQRRTDGFYDSKGRRRKYRDDEYY